MVIGANSDIAIATAHRFAKSGFNLYLASRNYDECKKNAADIMIRYQVDAVAMAFDARDYDSHHSFFGGLAVKPHGVVIAFGVMHNQEDSQENFTLTQEMIEVNYMGFVNISEIIAANFELRKSGFIAGMSSVAADRGRQSNYLYGSTKAAITTYLSGLRHRMIKSGVSVLTIKPGFVRTKMTSGLNLPAKLTAKPEQIAEAIFKGVKKKKSVIYAPPVWRLIMLIIIHMPSFIFHKTKL